MPYYDDESAQIALKEKEESKRWEFLKNLKLYHYFLIAIFILAVFYWYQAHSPKGTTPATTNDYINQYLPIALIIGGFILFLKGQQVQTGKFITRIEAENILRTTIENRMWNEKYTGFPSGILVITDLGKLTRMEPYIWYIVFFVREKVMAYGAELDHWYIGKVDAARGLGYIGSYVPSSQPTGAEGGRDWDYTIPDDVRRYYDSI